MKISTFIEILILIFLIIVCVIILKFFIKNFFSTNRVDDTIIVLTFSLLISILLINTCDNIPIKITLIE
jgi:amino acid transporter